MKDLGRYTQYLGGDVNDVIHKLELENERFRALIQQVRDEKGVQTLSWYTIMPVQRAMRFRLLLQDLLKHSPGDHPCVEAILFQAPFLPGGGGGGPGPGPGE